MSLTEEQYLLQKLSEECVEISKEVSKSIIFGIDDYEPNQDLSNKEKIENEITDLLAVVDMLCERRILSKKSIFNANKMNNKSAKVLKWMDYSKTKGILGERDEK